MCTRISPLAARAGFPCGAEPGQSHLASFLSGLWGYTSVILRHILLALCKFSVHYSLLDISIRLICRFIVLFLIFCRFTAPLISAVRQSTGLYRAVNFETLLAVWEYPLRSVPLSTAACLLFFLVPPLLPPYIISG